MGNCFGRSQKLKFDVIEDQAAPQKSEVEKKALDPKDFMFIGKRGETLVRKPHTINGEQFVIEECDDCSIFLCDTIECMTIDLCTNCVFFLGPVCSSVFIRDCVNCTFILACQQFRTRDCKHCTFSLYSQTRPIIETSVGLEFCCYSQPTQYPPRLLSEQFTKAALDVFTNEWSDIHNFSDSPAFSWAFCKKIEFPSLPADIFSSSENISSGSPQQTLQTEPLKTLVPITDGVRKKKRFLSSKLVLLAKSEPEFCSLALSLLLQDSLDCQDSPWCITVIKTAVFSGAKECLQNSYSLASFDPLSTPLVLGVDFNYEEPVFIEKMQKILAQAAKEYNQTTSQTLENYRLFHCVPENKVSQISFEMPFWKHSQ